MKDEETLIQHSKENSTNEEYSMSTRLSLSLLDPSEHEIELCKILAILSSRKKELPGKMTISDSELKDLKHIVKERKQHGWLIKGVKQISQSINS